MTTLPQPIGELVHDHEQPLTQKRPSSATIWIALVSVATAVSLAMFESAKQFLFPGIDLWQSHGLTILAGTVLVAVFTYLVVRRERSLKERAFKEQESRHDERRRIEQALQFHVTQRNETEDARLKLATLVENSNDFIGVAGLDDRITYLNSAGRKLAGLDEGEDVTATTISDYVTPDAQAQFRNVIRPSLLASGRWKGQSRFRHFKSGTAITVEVAAFTIADPQTRQPIAFATVARDISERTKLEETRRNLNAELEDRVRRRTAELDQVNVTLEREKTLSDGIIDSLPGIFVVFDRQGKYLRWNKNLERITGYAAAEIAAMNPLRQFAGKDRGLMTQTIETIFTDGCSTQETDLLTKDGQSIPFVVTGQRIVLGQVPCVVGIGNDISDRKRSEESLRSSAAMLREKEEDLSAVLNASPEAIGVVDSRTGLFQNLNPQAEHLYGLSCAQLEKIGPAQMSPEFQPDGRLSADKAMEKIQAAIRGDVQVFEWMHRSAQDKLIPCEVRFALLPAPRQHLVRFSVTDITERKRIEKELQRSEAHYRGLIERGHDIIALLDAKGNLLYTSPSIGQLGYTPEELVGRNVFELVHPDDLAHCMAVMREAALNPGTAQPNEYRFRHKDGSWRTLEGIGSIMLDESTGPTGVLNIRDITQRKQMEDKMRNANKFLDSIVDNLPLALFVKDVRNGFKTTVWNKASEQMFGIPRNQALGSTLHENWAPAQSAAFMADNWRAINERRVTDTPDEAVDTAVRGTIRIHTRKVPIMDEHEQVSQLLVMCEDITEAKLAEQHVRDSETLKHAVLDSLPYDIAVLNSVGKIIAVNEAWLAFGKANGVDEPSRAAVGANYLDVCRNAHGRFSEGAAEAAEGIANVLRGTLPGFALEYPCPSVDRQRWFMLSVTALNRETGGAVATHIDFSDRHLAEDTLREAKSLTEAANRDLLVIDQTHQDLFTCRTTEEVTAVLTNTLVAKFDAYFARVWLKRPGDERCGECVLAGNCINKSECLHLISSAGHYTHIDGGHRRVPLGAFKIGKIALGIDQGLVITNDVCKDEHIHDRAWAAREGLRSFAGFPLVRDGKVLGVMAMFSQLPMPPGRAEIINGADLGDYRSSKQFSQ